MSLSSRIQSFNISLYPYTNLNICVTPAYCLGITGGTAVASKALLLDSSSNVFGIGTLTSTNLVETLQTDAQTGITAVGTLTDLTVSGNINGVLATASQPNITTLGTLHFENSLSSECEA